MLQALLEGGGRLFSRRCVSSGPAQGAASQYSGYQQGQGQQYGSYRASQTGPSAQQQRPYGYEQARALACAEAWPRLLSWSCGTVRLPGSLPEC